MQKSQKIQHSNFDFAMYFVPYFRPEFTEEDELQVTKAQKDEAETEKFEQEEYDDVTVRVSSADVRPTSFHHLHVSKCCECYLDPVFRNHSNLIDRFFIIFHITAEKQIIKYDEYRQRHL